MMLFHSIVAIIGGVAGVVAVLLLAVLVVVVIVAIKKVSGVGCLYINVHIITWQCETRQHSSIADIRT